MGDEIRYHFYVTNVTSPRRSSDVLEVIFQSNARCNQEHVIKQLRAIQAMRMPASDLVDQLDVIWPIATLAFKIVLGLLLEPRTQADRRRPPLRPDRFPPASIARLPSGPSRKVADQAPFRILNYNGASVRLPRRAPNDCGNSSVA